MKEPKCKLCGGAHYKTFCPNTARKPIKQSAIKRPTYEEAKQKALKAAVRAAKQQTHKLSHVAPKPLKRAKISSQGTSLRAKLIREADRIFSIYIRRKDSFQDTAVCVTCGKRDHYKNMQNGHYVSRRIVSLRFEEMNAHVQCPKCNMELHGNMVAYRRYMIGTYGLAKVLELEKKAKAGGKVPTVTIQYIIEEYKKKLETII